jgi:hypothetical protein
MSKNVAGVAKGMGKQKRIPFFTRKNDGFLVRSQSGIELAAVTLDLTNAFQRNNQRWSILAGAADIGSLDVSAISVLKPAFAASPGSVFHQFCQLIHSGWYFTLAC